MKSVCVGVLLISFLSLANAEDAAELSTVTVHVSPVANLEPASTFATPITELRYHPQVDVQSRGLPEGQADITVRGSVFENVGAKLGAVTLHDPQTGHFTSTLPIDPALLSSAEVLTGVRNAAEGFNSSVATIQYDLATVREANTVSFGVGDFSAYSKRLHVAQTGKTDEYTVGAEVAYSKSEGDGSRLNGDYDFERFSGRVQFQGKQHQTDVVFGYQDTFYAWPGAYTGFASLAEFDQLSSSLVLINHERDVKNGQIAITGYLRTVDDDYDFNRFTFESNAPGAFEHQTKTQGLGFEGDWVLGDYNLNVASQIIKDELVSSTDLTFGDFKTREYAKLSVLPSRQWRIGGVSNLNIALGFNVDASNRNSNNLSPLFNASVLQAVAKGMNRYALDYSEATQLTGYTALSSNPIGLFGGNADLGREQSNTLELSWHAERDRWFMQANVFKRRDIDLVDWTFVSSTPSVRQANAVDLDVVGFEWLAGKHFERLNLSVGYTYLDKDADYGTVLVDASYYALNYAQHRLTFASVYQPTAKWAFRLDTELRDQVPNALRQNNSNQAFMASLGVDWHPFGDQGWSFNAVADNMTNSNFEEFPGAPATRRMFGVNANYIW